MRGDCLKKIGFLCLLWSLLVAAVSVQVDPKTIHLGDAVELTVTLKDQSAEGVPDLTPLEKEFDVIGTQHHVSYTQMNGEATMLNQWRIMIRPKISGKLLVPPIHIGHEHTAITSIEVLPSAEGRNHEQLDEDKGILLKNTVRPKAPIVNQEIIYTVKLYNSHQLLDASYHPPDAEDAIVVSLGEGDHYQVQENNRYYAVDEQRYAIFPQKSGKLAIHPPSFRALVYDYVPKRVNLKGKQLTLNVKPIPKAFRNKHWLPAKRVSLLDNYSSNSDILDQGQTVERHVTLKGKGLPEQLLPRLSFEGSSLVSVYAETPVTNNEVLDGELVGTATYKVTYVFAHAGTVTLPKLTVDWYNTKTGKQETASLPARTIHVNGVAAHANPTIAPPAPASASAPAALPEETQKPPRDWWPVVWHFAVGLLVLLGVVCLSFVAYFKRKNTTYKKNQALRQLKQACLKNDAHKTRDALLHWASLRWPNEKGLNLESLLSHLQDDAISHEIQRLSEALYSANPKPWTGKSLWRCISKHKAKKTSRAKVHLPPSNPL